MTLQQADKIIQIWGKYLEYVSRINFSIFMSSIPESTLPFPREVIMEATEIMIKYHINNSNQAAVDSLEACSASLLAFKPDEEAILSAVKLWSDPKSREMIIALLKKSQTNWIKTQDL